MNELPVITVVTPSYNQADYLETTILSVLKQDYSKLEYIVMDGGSNDSSVDIIKKYSSDINFWLTKKDKGQSDAIRKGFAKGTGEILCWINSDDAFLPNALSFVGEYFSKHPHVDVLLTGVAYADVNGGITKCYYYPIPSKVMAKMGAIAFGQQGMFFRRKKYEEIGGIKENYHYLMDLDFLYNSIYSGAKIDSKRVLTGVFRWHEDMKSINRTGRKAEEIELLNQEYDIRHKLKPYAKALYKLKQIFNFNYLYNYMHTMKYNNLNIKYILGINDEK